MPKNNNPTGKGGFRDHPENKGNGWKRPELTFSYQYSLFMGMTILELKDWALTPPDRRTVVQDLAYARVLAAKSSLLDVKEITDRIEGKPQQKIEHSGELTEIIISKKIIANK